MDSPGYVIRCIGRRRITVEPQEHSVSLHVWLGDPPNGKHFASLEMERGEVEKLLIDLTGVIRNA